MLESSIFLKAKNKLAIFLCLAITLSSFWLWSIVSLNLLVAFLLILLTVSCFSTFVYQGGQRRALLTAVLFLVMVGISLVLDFDKQLLKENPTAIALRNDRHILLSQGLGSLFQNKLAQNFYRNWYSASRIYQRNLSYSLSQNLYFFNNHPREVSGVAETSKFLSLLLPFFLLGGIFLLTSRFKETVIYIIGASIVSGFISPVSNFSSIIFFPIITVAITFGILIIVVKIQKK